MLQAGNHRMLFKELHDFTLHIIKGVFQNRAGVHKITIVQQEARNAQGADHSAGCSIKMLIVIIHKPVYAFIYNHIYTSIVQGCNAGEHNGGAVGLSSAAL